MTREDPRARHGPDEPPAHPHPADDPAAALTIGREHHRAGRLSDAERIYRQILDAHPNNADALHLLGLAAYQAGRHERAVELIRGAIRNQPKNAQFLNNLGTVYLALAKPRKAVSCFYQALEIDPKSADAHYNLANALAEQGRPDAAIARYERALEIDPDSADAHNNLGSVLQKQGRLDEATACYDRALEIDPDCAEAHKNLGGVLSAQGRLDEAVACTRRALEIDPNSAQTHFNLGTALKNQGKMDEAIGCYRRALEIDPDYAEAHWNYGLTLLTGGRFREGWAEYDWRWKRGGSRRQDFGHPRREFSRPPWDGSPLDGKTILLHAEQGLGDTIQFIRYGRLVADRGGRVVVECQPRLTRLLGTMPEIDHVVAKGDALPEFDVHAPLVDLPYLFDTDLETIPDTVPYLGPPPRDLIDLGPADRRKIGIVWAGRPTHKNDKDRSVELGQFRPLLDLTEFAFYGLQVGERRGDIYRLGLGASLTDIGDEMTDFAVTACAVKQLDLLISVDTAPAHLAGALAQPVWTLLPFVPDWRWMREREDTPWYPTMRLFRQQSRGDWQGVFTDVGRALARLASAP